MMIAKDTINPDHYKKGKVECIDAISSAVEGLEGVEAMLTGNAMKYLYRWKQKNGAEDLRKAQWYIDRLIKEIAPKSRRGLPDTDWYPPNNVDEVIFMPGLTD